MKTVKGNTIKLRVLLLGLIFLLMSCAESNSTASNLGSNSINGSWREVDGFTVTLDKTNNKETTLSRKEEIIKGTYSELIFSQDSVESIKYWGMSEQKRSTFSYELLGDTLIVNSLKFYYYVQDDTLCMVVRSTDSETVFQEETSKLISF